MSTTRVAGTKPARTTATGAWRDRLRVTVYGFHRSPGVRAPFPSEAEIECLVDLIDAGRAEPLAPASLTRVTAEALGGAIVLELCRGARDDPPPESELVPSLMYLAVLPYIGADAAAEELRAPPPPR